MIPTRKPMTVERLNSFFMCVVSTERDLTLHLVKSEYRK